MLDSLLFGNPVSAWLGALGVASAAVLALALLRRIVRRRLVQLAARTATRIDDAIVHTVDGTRLWLLAFVVLYVALQSLELDGRTLSLLRAAALLALLVQAGLWLSRLAGFWFSNAQKRALENNQGNAATLMAMGFLAQLLLWSVLVLVALDNFGVDITALVAGLGIGGIAVALAVQNILGDLFASLSILVDKPFVIGDFIVVDEFAGTVEHIGLKTTRIRSLGGEQLVFSNSDLLSTRVRNYKRMRERRIVFAFGVLYQTPAEVLAQIPQIVREAVCAQPNTRFDRAHFQRFGESAYEFEAVYWMLVPDYNAYMDTQQAVNLALVTRFAEHGIEFAFPTRTVFLAGQRLDPAAAT